MIRIVVEKVRVSSGFEGIAQEMVNAAAQGLADVMKKDGLERHACPHHPNHTGSTVVVKAIDSDRESLRVDKRGFCCREFENSVQVNFKR